MEKNRIKSNLLVIVFLLTIYVAPFLIKEHGKMDFVCSFSFLVNGLIFIIGIFKAKNRYTISIQLIYWLFMFFFMYFAPMIQYRLNDFPWEATVSDKEIIYANFIVFIFSIFFILGSFFARKIKIIGFEKLDITHWLCKRFEIKRKYRFLLTMIVCMLAIYSFIKTGVAGIVVSRAEAVKVFYLGDNSSVKLIVESTVPAFMTYIVADAAQCMANRREKGFRFLLLFVCLLVCFFPTAIPRYKAATIYGVILIVLLPSINKGARFFWVFTIGLFVIFPLLSAFRYVISEQSIRVMLNAGFYESYTKGDYDAYRMLISAIKYNSKYGCTWGYQLWGVLLFFIPRFMWKRKPIGSGAMLIKSELGNEVFSNVSCPFMAEGLVNFGLSGVVLFGLFLGAVVYDMDKKYWNNYKMNNRNELFSAYLFFVFMLFFLMRGDLLSGFAYICGFVFMGFILRTFTVQNNLQEKG